jgi:hypothetical protein
VKIVTCGIQPYESSLIVKFLRAGGTASLATRPGRQPWNVLREKCICCGVETVDYSAHIPRCASLEWDSVGTRAF